MMYIIQLVSTNFCCSNREKWPHQMGLDPSLLQNVEKYIHFSHELNTSIVEETSRPHRIYYYYSAFSYCPVIWVDKCGKIRPPKLIQNCLLFVFLKYIYKQTLRKKLSQEQTIFMALASLLSWTNVTAPITLTLTLSPLASHKSQDGGQCQLYRHQGPNCNFFKKNYLLDRKIFTNRSILVPMAYLHLIFLE